VNLLGALSYGSAAIAFLVLAAVLTAGWRGHGTGSRLILASAVSAVWAALLGLEYWHGNLPQALVPTAEWLRLVVWVFALGGIAQAAGVPRSLGWLSYALCAVGVAFALARLVAGPSALMHAWGGIALVAAGITFPIVGLILIEQLHRNSRAVAQRAVQPLLLGVGGMLMFDLAMYAESLMTQAVTVQTLAIRGFANALCVPAIALAARRNPAWSLDVFVSRHVVFYSTTLMVVGIYLLAMAAVGYLISAFGGRWGELAQLVFLFGAAIVLIVLVASDAVRNRLKVFLNKHFFRNKYDYRVEWLRFVNALEAREVASEARPAMIRAVAQIMGSHFGTLWIRADDEQLFVPVADWGSSRAARPASLPIAADAELVTFLEQRNWIFDLTEYRRSPATYPNLRLPEALAADSGLTIYVPLMHGRRAVGLLGLGPPDAPFVMNFEDRDLLKTVGRHVGTYIAHLEADRRLTESRQFEAYSRMTAFVMHDLKNLLAQLSLVVANAERHRRNPAFVDDTIDTIRNSTDRMTRLVEQLNQGELRSSERPVDLLAMLERVAERTSGREPVPTIHCATASPVVMADPDRLMTAVEHIVRNAQDATPAGGAVRIELSREGERAVIQVSDTGGGMTAEFIRDRLFRPFDSTKGSKGMGIGAYQVRDYVRSLHGDVAVSSTLGGGTRFTVSLPSAAAGRED